MGTSVGWKNSLSVSGGVGRELAIHFSLGCATASGPKSGGSSPTARMDGVVTSLSSVDHTLFCISGTHSALPRRLVFFKEVWMRQRASAKWQPAYRMATVGEAGPGHPLAWDQGWTPMHLRWMDRGPLGWSCGKVESCTGLSLVRWKSAGSLRDGYGD